MKLNLMHLAFSLIGVLFLTGLIVCSARADTNTTITVTTNADELNGKSGNGNCSLREAISNANNNDQAQADCSSGSHTDIIILPAGIYTLTGSPGEDANTTGDLDITDSLQINGAGSRDTTIQAGTTSPVSDTCRNCVDRVIDIHVGAEVEINDVTMRYGLTPDGVGGVNNGMGQPGGGIRVLGSLTLNSCSVNNNRTGDGAVNPHSNGGYGGPGGGIYVDGGPLVLNNSNVRLNRTGDGSSGDLTGTISGMGGWGGGIQINYYDEMTITHSVISYNTSGNGGPGVDTNDINAGKGGGGGFGGGIQSTGATVTITGSTIQGNTTGDGGDGGDVLSGNGNGGNGGAGGVGGGFHSNLSYASLTLQNSTISDNSTGLGGLGGEGSGMGADGVDNYQGDGGGIHANDGSFTLKGCTISGNTALGGAGIQNASEESTMLIENCTISGNMANAMGGGIGTGSLTNTELFFVTITANVADMDNDGSGDGGGIGSGSGTITATNSIIAGNIDNGGQDPDCWGWVQSGDYNLFGIAGSALCTFYSQSNDQVGSTASPLNPFLDLLANNGGETDTHALLPGSPAINQIPSGTNGCQIGVTLDQRGVLRILACDVGAYEFDQVSYVFLPLVMR